MVVCFRLDRTQCDTKVTRYGSERHVVDGTPCTLSRSCTRVRQTQCTPPPLSPAPLASALRLFLALVKCVPHLNVHVRAPEHADEEADEAAIGAHDCEDPADDGETSNAIGRAPGPEHRPSRSKEMLIIEYVPREVRHDQRHGERDDIHGSEALPVATALPGLFQLLVQHILREVCEHCQVDTPRDGV